MGKGSGDECRGAISLHEGSAGTVPGKSERARHTFTLLQQAGGFSQHDLLRDIRSRDGRTVPAAKADASIMTHNAMMRWVPSSYPGHGGYVPAHEPARWEMHFCVLLDGDRRANHLYFYNDKTIGGQWTLPAGAAVRGWYRLPCDEHGHLDPAGLRQAVQAGLEHPDGLFVDNLRARPSQTLARCVDLDEPAASDPELLPRLALLSYPAQQAVVVQLGRAEQQGRAASRQAKLTLASACALAEDAGLPDPERDLLLSAAAYAPPFGTSPADAQRRVRAELDLQLAEPVAALLAELAPYQAADDPQLPVLEPATKLGRLLADVQQSFMASVWCDEIAELQRQASGAPDDVQWLERTRMLAARSPWHSQQGRARYQSEARKQETRLRSLIGLAEGVKTPAAPKGLKRLRPAALMAG